MVSTDGFRLADFAAALLDPGHVCPQGLRAWNGSDPSTRLAIYRNNVLSSLIDALTETFPVVQELVGVDFFRAMAGVFVRQSPPRSRVLAYYGDELPLFIEQFGPAQSVPYLADIARLEIARVQAHHAADAEPVSAEHVSMAISIATKSKRMGELALVCHPSVTTISSAFAMVSLWAAHQGSGSLDQVDVSKPEAAIVLRQFLDVLVLHAPRGAVRFLESARKGSNLGDSAASAAKADPAFDVTATLTLLLAHGALTSLHLPKRQFSCP